jgi:hypothetical protein
LVGAKIAVNVSLGGKDERGLALPREVAAEDGR